MMLSFTLISLSSSLRKPHIIYGKPGVDHVVNDEPDGFEVLEILKKPTNVKHIKELHLTDTILDTDYPIDGRAANKSRIDDIISEGDQIYTQFCKVGLTEEQLYYHPAGNGQYGGDDEKIANAERIKARLILHPYYPERHSTGLYAPPGELITFDIPQKLVGKISFTINPQSQDINVGNNKNAVNKRLTKLSCQQKLNAVHSTFVWPYGGLIIITPGWYEHGIEINISGCIRHAYFIYGKTSDEDWKKEIEETAAPSVVLDNRISTWYPRKDVFDSTSNSINNIMAYWRSVGYSMNAICYSTDNALRADGRYKLPIRFHFDTLVPPGTAAVAYYGGHSIQMPNSWANDDLHDFDSLMTGYWGLGHEYAHHHQNGWGFGEKGEVSNNLHNIISYSLYSSVSGTRRPQIDSKLKITTRDAWEYTTHGYTLITSDRSSENYDFLNFYGNPVYSFGPRAYREFLHQDFLNDKGAKSGLIFMKLLTEMFHLDFEEYFNSYSYTMPTPSSNTNMYTQEEMEKLRNYHYPSYHPVANAYENGFLDENNEYIETGRPFEIAPKQQYLFDFKRFTKTRKQMTYTYSIQNVEVVNGTLEKVDDGMYYYTPVEDIHSLDRIIVTYKDDTNDQLRKSVISIKQGSDRPYYAIYANAISDDVVESYQHIVDTKQVPVFTEISDKFGTRNHVRSDLDKTICISSGSFYPEYNDTYQFSLVHRGQVLFYLSESPLSGNPKTDSNYLVIHSKNDHTSNAENGENFYSVKLVADTKYYYKIVILKPNKDADSYVNVNLKNSAQPEYELGSVDRIFCPDCSPDMEDPYPFISPLEDFECIGKYNYDKFIYHNSTGYEVTKIKYPYTDHTQLFDGLITSPSSFTYGGGWPQIVEITLNKPETFNALYLPSMTTKNYDMDSDVIFEAELNGKKTVLYEGVYNKTTTLFRFGKYITADKVTLTAKNNRILVYAYVSYTEFALVNYLESSGEYVIPITHTNHTIHGKAEWTSAGLYYNNKGLLLHEGAEYTIHINDTQGIVVIGDRGAGCGEFEFYVDGNLLETVDTSTYSAIMNVSMVKQGATKTYQKPLCIANYIGKGDHVVSIRATKGTVGLAGFASDTPPTINIPPKSIAEIEEEPNDPELNNQQQDTHGQNSGGLTTAQVAGISVGVVIAVAAIVAVIVFVIFKFHRNPNQEKVEEENSGSDSVPV